MTPETTAMSRYEFAASELRGRSGIVFDVGCSGDGMRGAARSAGLSWRGFDLDPQHPEVTHWDLSERCPSNETPDVVLMLDVIEHLYNPGLAVTNIAAVMPPNSSIIITTPNPRWSRSRVSALLTGFPTCFTKDDLGNHHVWPAWPHVLEHLLCRSGFSIEKYVTLDGAYTWPKPSRGYPVRLAHAALNKFIERLDPSACGMSYAIVAKRQYVPSIS